MSCGICCIVHAPLTTALQHHPTLSAFCTNLTGITQDQVDSAPEFPEAFRAFRQWLAEEGILSGEISFAFVTCGKRVDVSDVGVFDVSTEQEIGI
jgi:DNA polymerase III alpha subunit (gram-positive type)